jgi:hypothetical protein
MTEGGAEVERGYYSSAGGGDAGEAEDGGADWVGAADVDWGAVILGCRGFSRSSRGRTQPAPIFSVAAQAREAFCGGYNESPMIHRRSFLASMASTLAAHLAAAPSKPPNIVFILCDDLGYGDLGCYGSKIPTPNLDSMAAAGVRFTNFSSADPVCSPSRAALLTGRYPTRVGVPRVFFPQDKGGMNLDEVTLANVLKDRGYRTICIGKWHLGRPLEYLPTSRGFDEYFGIPYSNDMNPRVLMHNTEVIEREIDLSTLKPRYMEQDIRFVRVGRHLHPVEEDVAEHDLCVDEILRASEAD